MKRIKFEYIDKMEDTPVVQQKELSEDEYIEFTSTTFKGPNGLPTYRYKIDDKSIEIFEVEEEKDEVDYILDDIEELDQVATAIEDKVQNIWCRDKIFNETIRRLNERRYKERAAKEGLDEEEKEA
jgi:hypothetical protein